MLACGRKVAGRWGTTVAHVVIFENFCKLSLLSDQIGESELVPVLSAAPGAGAGCSHLILYVNRAASTIGIHPAGPRSRCRLSDLPLFAGSDMKNLGVQEVEEASWTSKAGVLGRDHMLSAAMSRVGSSGGPWEHGELAAGRPRREFPGR